MVALGYRDAAEQAAGSQPLPARLRAVDLAAVRARGAAAAAQDAVSHLTRRGGPDRFWIHLDADVLDDAVMPAVDYRQPDGLTWDELRVALRMAAASPAAVGLDVTIYNPRLDPDGSAARGLVAVLADVLA